MIPILHQHVLFQPSTTSVCVNLVLCSLLSTKIVLTHKVKSEATSTEAVDDSKRSG